MSRNCCCCYHHRGHCYKKSNADVPVDQSQLKSRETVCQICGQNVLPEQFCGTIRIRCPCHGSIDGVFASHSTDILGNESKCGAGDCTGDVDVLEYDHGRKASRNPRYPWLDWRLRPMICNVSVKEKRYTWNLKRKTPAIPDVYYHEMYDINRKRYY